MTDNKAVADGKNLAAINHLLDTKFEDLKRRVIQGTLPIVPVARVMQEIIEGKFVIGGLLQFVGYLNLKAVKRFIVANNFKTGNVVGGRKIGPIGNNFRKHFGDLVEEDVPERTVYIWELVSSSLNAPIIRILGGQLDGDIETHLAHMFQMMELGEKGRVRLNSYPNFGYKRSPRDGTLWVPNWRFIHLIDSFDVEAFSSSSIVEWGRSYRVSGG